MKSVIPILMLLVASAGALSAQEAQEVKIKGFVIHQRTNDVVTNLAEVSPLLQGHALTNVTDVVVVGPEFLKKHAEELNQQLAKYRGWTVSPSHLRHIQTNIVLLCRYWDHLVVDVIYPVDQPIESGVVQILVIEGKVGQVHVDNSGRKWFSDNLMRRGVRVKPDEAILESQLTDDLRWLSRNEFFRRVEAQLIQGTNFGAVDLKLKVNDRFPVRPFVGYDDAGNDVLGNHRLNAGFNWGNAFFQDHQLSYQFTSDIEFEYIQSHAGSYVAPLPWHHAVRLVAAYSDIQGDMSGFLNDPNFAQDGSYLQASARYDVRLPAFGGVIHSVSAGFDYKRMDNNLLFGGDSFFDTPTEIDQFALEYRAKMFDKWGDTGFGLLGFYSPGGISGENSDENFADTRPGATADYYYVQLQADRLTKLPWLNKDWNDRKRDVRECYSLFLKGGFQYTPDRLLPSEQWGLGGFATVRGYDERLVNGDYGWLVTAELRSPEFPITGWLTKKKSTSVLGTEFDRRHPTGGWGDRLQVLAFFDYGSALNNDPQEGELDQLDLYSVGGGVRLSVSRNFWLRFDYGVQLTETSLSENGSRAHFGLEASY